MRRRELMLLLGGAMTAARGVRAQQRYAELGGAERAEPRVKTEILPSPIRNLPARQAGVIENREPRESR